MAKNKSPMKSTPTVQHKKKNKGSCKYSGFCPLTNPGDFKWEKGLEIVNADKISDKEFFNRFIKTRTPCIIRGPVSDLNPDVFSLESLGLLAQNADVVVEKRGGSVKNFGEGRKIQMKFDELVDKIEKGDTEHYMTTQPLPEDLLGYKELFAEPLCSIAGSFPTLPQFISQGVVPHQVNMWLGNTPKGTSSTSGLHHDFHDNVYLLISGKKTFRLFSPTMADQLGLVGNLKKVLPNGLIVYSNSESGPSTPADEVREDGAPMLEVMKWKARGRKCLRDGIEKMMKGDEQQKGEESGEEGEEIDLDELDLEEFEGMSSGEDEDEDASEGGRGGEAGRLSMPSDSEEEEEEEEEEGEEEEGESDAGDDEDFDMFTKGFADSDDENDFDSDDGLMGEDDEEDDEEDSGVPEGEKEEALATLNDWVDKGYIEAEEADAWNMDGFESSEEEDSDEDVPKKLLGKGDRVAVGEKPISFCKNNTIPRKDAKKSAPAESDNVLSKYLEVDILPGDMLYLPASWFHEVLSCSQEPSKKSVFPEGVEGKHHLALNWWFYPVCSSKTSSSEQPYEDSFWKRNTRSVLDRSYKHVLKAMGLDDEEEEGEGEGEEGEFFEITSDGEQPPSDDEDQEGGSDEGEEEKEEEDADESSGEEIDPDDLDEETLAALMRQVAADHPSESEDEENASYSEDSSDEDRDGAEIEEEGEDEEEGDDEELSELDGEDLAAMGFVTGSDIPPMPESEDEDKFTFEKPADYDENIQKFSKKNKSKQTAIQQEEEQEGSDEDNQDDDDEDEDDVYKHERHAHLLSKLVKRRVFHHKAKAMRFMHSVNTANYLNQRFARMDQEPTEAVDRAKRAVTEFKNQKQDANCNQQ